MRLSLEITCVLSLFAGSSIWSVNGSDVTPGLRKGKVEEVIVAAEENLVKVEDAWIQFLKDLEEDKGEGLEFHGDFDEEDADDEEEEEDFEEGGGLDDGEDNEASPTQLRALGGKRRELFFQKHLDKLKEHAEKHFDKAKEHAEKHLKKIKKNETPQQKKVREHFEKIHKEIMNRAKKLHEKIGLGKNCKEENKCPSHLHCHPTLLKCIPKTKGKRGQPCSLGFIKCKKGFKCSDESTNVHGLQLRFCVKE